MHMQVLPAVVHNTTRCVIATHLNGNAAISRTKINKTPQILLLTDLRNGSNLRSAAKPAKDEVRQVQRGGEEKEEGSGQH